MKETVVALLTEDSALEEQLRPRVDGFRLVGRQAAGAPISVIDGTSMHCADSSVARIFLVDADEDAVTDRATDLVVSREEFLRRPLRYLQIARHIATREELVDELERELTFLEEIPSLASMNDPARVSEHITRTVLDLLGLDHATLLLHDARSERFLVSFSTDRVDGREGFIPGIPATLLQQALERHSYALDRGTAEADGALIIPIETGEDVIAVLRVTIPRGVAFDDATAVRAARYVANVSAVLGNVYQLTRSRELAMRDDLTKAFNRRFFESYLDEEIERARRYGTVCSIIFLDLDDLKLVNDRYGHLAGSRTLQEVAKRILGAVRGIDKLVRFGGDEFCIVLPQTDSMQARNVAARVQKALATAPFRIEEGIEVPITASFGVSTYPVHGRTKEDLVRGADGAMYRVKTTTKDAIGVAGETVTSARQVRAGSDE